MHGGPLGLAAYPALRQWSVEGLCATYPPTAGRPIPSRGLRQSCRRSALTPTLCGLVSLWPRGPTAGLRGRQTTGFQPHVRLLRLAR